MRLVHTTIDPMMGNIRVIGSETQNVKNYHDKTKSACWSVSYTSCQIRIIYTVTCDHINCVYTKFQLLYA